MNLVLFPNAVKIVGAHLRDVLDGVPVSRDVPNPRPRRFVVLRRVGGVARTIVSDEPTLRVECWGADDDDAHDLAQEVRMRLAAMRGHMSADGHVVYRVGELAGPGRLPDPTSDHERYVFTASVHVRGASYSPDESA